MTVVGSTWWTVVRALTNLHKYDPNSSPDRIHDQSFMATLRDLGFLEKDILKALDWLDELPGGIYHSECLTMITPPSDTLRINHPLDDHILPPGLWRFIMLYRSQGLLNDDTIEMLIEVSRSFDTSEWEEEDSKELLIEVLCTLHPSMSEESYRLAIDGRLMENYS